MIVTKNLSREYGHKIALFGLNLRVEPGEILGFLGPNGAGKSTTVKILTGMIRPTSGELNQPMTCVISQRISMVRSGVPYCRTSRKPAKAMKICFRQPSRKHSR